MEEPKFKYKVLLWGTFIVSLVPPTYIYIAQAVFGSAGARPCVTVEDYAISCLFSVLVTFSLFLANIYIIKTITTKYEEKLSAFKRIGLSLGLGLIISNIIIYFEWQIFNNLYYKLNEQETKMSVFQNQMFATVLVIIVSLVLEIRHYVEKLKISIAEKEKLEREFLRAQLEGLKTQISPHFLFNSFNALQSLIEDDATKAKEFVQELASVYRYVLEKRDQLVVTLFDEMQFIQSFIYLNKIRFGDNLMVETQIDADSLNHYLPPLTLQLLVENAIKHNVISTAKPLVIQIIAKGDQLTISNVFQPRAEKLQSTQIGHQNLISRYQLICDSIPTFALIDNLYVAQIPLVSQTVAEEL